MMTSSSPMSSMPARRRNSVTSRTLCAIGQGERLVGGVQHPVPVLGGVVQEELVALRWIAARQWESCQEDLGSGDCIQGDACNARVVERLHPAREVFLLVGTATPCLWLGDQRRLGDLGWRHPELQRSHAAFGPQPPRCIKLPNGDLRVRRGDLDNWLDDREDGA